MITAIVLAKNEEKDIGACLDSLSWCDEMLVIDDNSTDKTVEIAKKKGARVITHAMQGNFANQRNFGLEKAKNEWVLFIDADERVSSPLWYEIMQETNESIGQYTGFYVARLDTMWGQVLKHGETGNTKLLRLAKKHVGKWQGRVHETWKISGKTGMLKNQLDHFPHETVEEFLKEINFYTDLRSADLFERKVKAYWWSPLVYPIAKFNLNYIGRRGFQDGLPGLVFAMIMSFHSFLVRSKLWLMWQKKSND